MTDPTPDPSTATVALTDTERNLLWDGMLWPEGAGVGEPNVNLDGVLSDAMPGATAAVERIVAARLAEKREPREQPVVDATWALNAPDLWESPDARSVPTLLAAIGQVLAATEGRERRLGQRLTAYVTRAPAVTEPRRVCDPEETP